MTPPLACGLPLVPHKEEKLQGEEGEFKQKTKR
jgi:hypothetical protein